MSPRAVVVGAGLGGSLMAALLGRDGWEVEVVERRLDPRQTKAEEGRSINLALSERGLHALGQIGLADEVLHARPVLGDEHVFLERGDAAIVGELLAAVVGLGGFGQTSNRTVGFSSVSGVASSSKRASPQTTVTSG